MCPDRGLYVITPAAGDGPSLAEAVSAAIRGGAALVQYRAKSSLDPRAQAAALLTVCRSAGVPLIVNDDVDLATELGADGVHVGKDDRACAAARRALGPGAIVGVSCYDSTERALKAQADGASYVAFGRFFPSKTKPDAPGASLATLSAARTLLDIPIVAIGGITSANGAALLAAGANLLAVIDGVFGADDPYQAAQAFRRLFETSERPA